MAIQGGF